MPRCCYALKRVHEAWAKWRGLISERAWSGQSVAAFCREFGLCAPRFFAWKKRLRQAAANQGALAMPMAPFGPFLPGRLALRCVSSYLHGCPCR